MSTAHPARHDAAPALFELAVSGPVHRVEAHADGSWTVVPVHGRPLLLSAPAHAAAYVDQADSTGPAALAPAPAPLPAAPRHRSKPKADEDQDQDQPTGCGCVGRPRTVPATYEADLMQARAVSAALGDLGVMPDRRRAAWDEQTGAVAVRVTTSHGLYSLILPPVGRPFTVHREGRRDGSLGARRIPAVRDSLIATLYTAYLRDRGCL